MMFKNTVLLLVIALASCGNAVKSKDNDLKIKNSRSDTKVSRLLDDKTIIIGANQTEAYLSILKGKNVGVVANQTSVIFKTKGNSIYLVDPETNEEIFEKFADAIEKNGISEWDKLEKLFIAKCFLTLEDRVYSFLSMSIYSCN